MAAPSNGDEPLAPERYNAFVLTGGQAASPWDLPRDRAALSDHAAFRVWSGHGESFVRSTTDLSRKGLEAWDWPRAETMPYVPATSSFAASAERDYLVLTTATAETDSGPARLHVQTVAAGTTAVATDQLLPLASIDGLVESRGARGCCRYGIGRVPRRRLGVIADRRLPAATAAQRGPRPDLVVPGRPPRRGRIHQVGIPTPQVAADGRHLAVYLDKPPVRYTDAGRRTVLRSDDGGQSWTELGDPEPTTSGSAVGIGGRDGELRAAWTVQSGGHVTLRSSLSKPGSGWSTPEDLPDDDLGATRPLSPRSCKRFDLGGAGARRATPHLVVDRLAPTARGRGTWRTTCGSWSRQGCVIRRSKSERDGRRSYVRLRPDNPLLAALDLVPGLEDSLRGRRRVVFVCTENAARSQLAA